jgi:HAMP domain-containing protein/HPt (histidine-containing phosphotransfer) domain-containing protein
MGISLKAKIISIMVALSVVGLAIYANSSLQIYKKDKTALLYDYVANETQSKATFIAHTIDSLDMLASTIISNISQKTNYLQKNTVDYLKNNKNILGIYFHLDLPKLRELILTESNIQKKYVDWELFKNKDLGLTSSKEGEVFFYKKPIKNKEGFILIVFKDINLNGMIESSQESMNLLFEPNSIIGKNLDIAQNELLMILQNKFEKQMANFGLFEISIKQVNYILSFARIKNSNWIAITLKNQKKVFETQNIFVDQSIMYFLIIISIALLVGTISSRWLTWNLDKLAFGAHEMGLGNFKYKINIKTGDEFQSLANAYNQMGEKIFGLMQELKDYNMRLEIMVEERTAELKKITDIQKSMLNSLGQAFVMIDNENNILPIYSKISEDMFEEIPNKVKPHNILSIDDNDAQNYSDLFNFTFNKTISIDDLKALIPEKRSNSKNQIIHLDYAPIINSENENIDYIMIIGTDKTKEIESIEKFEREWNYSKMINKLASNKFVANKLITDSEEMLDSCEKDLFHKDVSNLIKIQRKIHTIKGNFSYFNIKEISDLAHEAESHLDLAIKNNSYSEKTSEYVLKLKREINSFLETHDGILQHKDSIDSKQINIFDLKTFHSQLSDHFAQDFEKKFLHSPIKPYFQIYPQLVHDLAEKNNKKIQLVLSGEENKIPDRNWSELFNSFIHFIRNSIDHGIENEEERTILNKPIPGTIGIDFKIVNDNLCIKLYDDGRGLDWKKLANKDSMIKSEQDALNKIILGGLSQNDNVTELSGRGVGVSALFEMVTKWDGKYEIINQVGNGFSIFITLPLYSKINKIGKAV